MSHRRFAWAGIVAVSVMLSACSSGETASTTPEALRGELTTTPTTAAPTTTRPPTSTPTTLTTTTVPASPPEASTPASDCQSRPPASEELIVRETDPATSSFAYDVGGGWTWTFDTEECITSSEFVLRTIPLVDGYCIEVAPKSANPGYDITADPAPPLRGAIGRAGDC
jgi:hypothetical protein